jgi:excisionase family DNA binding protein
MSSEPIQHDDPFTVQTISERELCERLGMDQKTAWRLRQSGRLKFFKIGGKVRYSREHVAAFLASCEAGTMRARRRA